MKALAWQFVRFGGVGLIGTSAHYLVLLILVEALAQTPVFASSCGAVAGALINYILNRRITFASTRPHREALPRFLLVALAGLVLNAVFMAAQLGMGVHYLLAQLVATALVLVFNFVANRLWTFKTHP